MREINAAYAAMVWIPTRAILHRHGFGWQVKVLGLALPWCSSRGLSGHGFFAPRWSASSQGVENQHNRGGRSPFAQPLEVGPESTVRCSRRSNCNLSSPTLRSCCFRTRRACEASCPGSLAHRAA